MVVSMTDVAMEVRWVMTEPAGRLRLIEQGRVGERVFRGKGWKRIWEHYL